eukprot:scaffold300140_cov21-Tisochrysis_lutea.AAC.1
MGTAKCWLLLSSNTLSMPELERNSGKYAPCPPCVHAVAGSFHAVLPLQQVTSSWEKHSHAPQAGPLEPADGEQ